MTRAFAYLDINHPIVAWAVYRGVLVSARINESNNNYPISMMLAGIIINKNINRLSNELLIEKFRQEFYSDLPSRLSAMYFFENKENAKTAEEWGGHFIPENLTEFELHPIKPISRHDANWITYAPISSSGHIECKDWIHNYWRGEVFPNKKPSWELLCAQGRALVCDKLIREKAYSRIIQENSLSVAILEISRIAAYVGSDLGQVKPFIIKESKTKLKVEWYIDMQNAEDPATLEAIRNYSGPKNHKDLSVGGDMFSVPNFGSYNCSIDLIEPISQQFLHQIHSSLKLS